MSDETPTIPPALSRPAWKHFLNGSGCELAEFSFSVQEDGQFYADHWAGGTRFTPEERHALAALCLHGQPYGFTREDVAALRFVARAATITRSGPPLIPDAGSLARVEAVAARLAALLPPEG